MRWSRTGWRTWQDRRPWIGRPRRSCSNRGGPVAAAAASTARRVAAGATLALAIAIASTTPLRSRDGAGAARDQLHAHPQDQPQRQTQDQTQNDTSRGSRSRTAFAGKLPALDGRHLQATLLEVTYPPGGANPAHRHPCPVIGYVLEGAIRMQVQGQPERIVKPGETFIETPSDVHLVSANASADAPARFLAWFVCDRETRLSVPLAAALAAAEKGQR